MSSSEADVQSFFERLISSRNRDLSLLIPFFLGFSTVPDPDTTRPESAQTEPDPDDNSGNNPGPSESNRRERLILINPLTQGMVVIEGTGLDSLFRGAQGKEGQPPASKSSVEAMPRVEIREDEEGECVICLEEFSSKDNEVVKEMPCKHRFHGECVEKWLRIHGSCPVCRYTMPVEEEDKEEKKGEEREIWVRFALGRRTRREERESDSDGDADEDRAAEGGDHMD